MDIFQQNKDVMVSRDTSPPPTALSPALHGPAPELPRGLQRPPHRQPPRRGQRQSPARSLPLGGHGGPWLYPVSPDFSDV